MVEKDSVIVELTPRELMLIGALSLLWKSVLEGIPYDPKAYSNLLASSIDGSFNAMNHKFLSATYASADGERNL